MTKPTVAVLATLTALMLAVPTAVAHGAPESRSIETRLLADDDGYLHYATGFEGHDLLALDVREALGPSGGPAIWFRLMWQNDAPADTADDITDTLSFELDGTSHSFGVTANYDEIFSHDFSAAYGPYTIGDGHPRAVDLVLEYAAMGAEIGDTLSDIKVVSSAGGEDGELMPGTYFMDGSEAPYLGDPSHSEPAPASMTLAGPASLLTVALPEAHWSLGDEPIHVMVNLSNPLADFEQVVTMSWGGSDAINVSDPGVIILAPGATRSINLTVSTVHDFEHEMPLIAFLSDLGGGGSFVLHLGPAGMDHGAHHNGTDMDHDADHDMDHNGTDLDHDMGHDGSDLDGGMDHEHDGDEHDGDKPLLISDDQAVPGAALPLLAAALAIGAFVARRRFE